MAAGCGRGKTWSKARKPGSKIRRTSAAIWPACAVRAVVVQTAAADAVLLLDEAAFGQGRPAGRADAVVRRLGVGHPLGRPVVPLNAVPRLAHVAVPEVAGAGSAAVQPHRVGLCMAPQQQLHGIWHAVVSPIDSARRNQCGRVSTAYAHTLAQTLGLTAHVPYCMRTCLHRLGPLEALSCAPSPRTTPPLRLPRPLATGSLGCGRASCARYPLAVRRTGRTRNRNGRGGGAINEASKPSTADGRRGTGKREVARRHARQHRNFPGTCAARTKPTPTPTRAPWQQALARNPGFAKPNLHFCTTAHFLRAHTVLHASNQKGCAEALLFSRLCCAHWPWSRIDLRERPLVLRMPLPGCTPFSEARASVIDALLMSGAKTRSPAQSEAHTQPNWIGILALVFSRACTRAAHLRCPGRPHWASHPRHPRRRRRTPRGPACGCRAASSRS
jgi:hypothetical protein